MNERIKQLWLAKLRSGSVRQVRNMLQSELNPSFVCAVGALGLVYNELHPTYAHDLKSCGALPASIRRWCGISDKTVGSITWLNDERCWSFAQIASFIECDAAEQRRIVAEQQDAAREEEA